MFLYIVLIPVVFVALITIFLKKTKKSINNRHVLITGGSSGIGKALGILAAQQGAHVTILARNRPKLKEAQYVIQKNALDESQKISTVSVDVTNKLDVENCLNKLEETVGPIYMLINCAGFALCGKFENMSEKDIAHLINVNLLGTIYPTQIMIPKFKERSEGIIVITGSVVTLMGMFGYSIYSSCKFALRGLAESLYMEVKPYNISVTLALPPDTDTPGFENENKSKPLETRLISESGGLYSSQSVAKRILNDALKCNFFSSIGFESLILKNLCVGMSPFNSVLDVCIQCILLGPLRFVAAFYVKHFEKVIKKCFDQKNK